MFLYGTSFGENPSTAPNFPDALAAQSAAAADRSEQAAAAEALWNTTRDLQLYKENANAEYQATVEAYDRRNKAIFDASGVQLENPMTYDVLRLKEQPGAAGLPEPAAVDDIAAQQADWQKRVDSLARERPELAAVIAADRPIRDDAIAIAQQAVAADAAAQARADAAGVPRARRVLMTLGGGFVGSLRDPLQVATLFAGGTPVAGPGRSVFMKILDSVLTEAAVNGGSEAAVQAASFDWKQKAGLDPSVIGSLEQVGMAALFGGGEE